MLAFLPIASILAISFGVTSAQSNVANATAASLPACALTCTIANIAPCTPYGGVTNLTCICTSAAFQLAYYNCQLSSCSAPDVMAAEAYGSSTCASNGTPINIGAVPSGVSTAANGATSVAAGASSAASSAAPTSAAASAPASSTTAVAAPPATTSAKAAAGFKTHATLVGGLIAVVAGGLVLVV